MRRWGDGGERGRVFKIMPSPRPEGHPSPKLGRGEGVREKGYGCYRHKTCMNEARGNSIKVNSLGRGGRGGDREKFEILNS